jgi:hypothetical protein
LATIRASIPGSGVFRSKYLESRPSENDHFAGSGAAVCADVAVVCAEIEASGSAIATELTATT